MLGDVKATGRLSFMADVRKGVTEFIRAGKSLLEMKNLSEDEEQVVRDMLWQLVIRFPDEGDDAAD
jgi:hypothetical protein